MSAGPAPARFYEARREAVPTDVGLFWEPDIEALEKRLHDTEAERLAMLARIEEVWADRTAWIDRYTAMDTLHHALARERDALLTECEGLRIAVVQARELRVREQHGLAEQRAAADVARATLTIERDRLAAEHDRLLAQYAALDRHAAEIEADRGLVEQHRDALAADREVQIAARAVAEAALAAPRRAVQARRALSKLRRAARRIFSA